jgi:phage baseplate assembly protein W
MNGEFLGVGWSFPLEFEQLDGSRRSIKLAEYEESIRQSIRIILETARGERVMRPDFGCGIHERVFALNDSATRGIIADEVREALLNWEPRIDVLEVETRAEGPEGQALLINIEYKVRSTDNRFNLVYPFYLNRSPV